MDNEEVSKSSIVGLCEEPALIFNYQFPIIN